MSHPQKRVMAALGIKEGDALETELREEALNEMADDFLADLKTRGSMSDESKHQTS